MKAPATIERHLVLVRSLGWQAPEDWREIAERIRALDRRIGVFLVDATGVAAEVAEHAAQRPTLVVSPAPVDALGLSRGRLLCGRVIAKMEQLRILNQAGVSVPSSRLLHPDATFDPQIWGDIVVLKPADILSSSTGAGISLVRTERLRFRPPHDYPEGHPGRRGPMIVQQFIDTGAHVSSYRVLMFMGAPLYCQRMEALAPRVELDATNEVLEAAPLAMQSHADRRAFVYEADVVDIARRAALAFSDIPLLGCDVLRDARTGQLFVTEVNPGGNTWHFSSLFLAEERARNGEAFERERREQLDAFGSAAVALVGATWELAV